MTFIRIKFCDMKKGYLVLLLSVLLSGLTAYGVVKAATPTSTTTAPAATISFNDQGQPVKTVNLSLSDYPDFTYAAENAVNAVVYVEVSVKYRQQYQLADPFFQFFFGDGYGRQPQTREREQKGSGSGVIIRQDGYIVTNNHVVDLEEESYSSYSVKSKGLTIEFCDGSTASATIRGTDANADLAVVSVKLSELSSDTKDAILIAVIGDSDALKVGEGVVAIGNAGGYGQSVTAGIISAKNREVTIDNITRKLL